MKCACVYVEDDGDSPDFFNAKIFKAKKAHKCTECRRAITPGEEYEYVSGKWEGRFEAYKTCQDCLSIRNEFFCDGYSFGDLRSDLTDYIWGANGDIPESCLSALTPAARDMVCEIIEGCWDEK
jgi:hypothetical protein